MCHPDSGVPWNMNITYRDCNRVANLQEGDCCQFSQPHPTPPAVTVMLGRSRTKVDLVGIENRLVALSWYLWGEACLRPRTCLRDYNLPELL